MVRWQAGQGASASSLARHQNGAGLGNERVTLGDANVTLFQFALPVGVLDPLPKSMIVDELLKPT